MTRFARAKGSKASNERVPEEATSWTIMKQQLLENDNNLKNRENEKKINEQKTANYQKFLKEKEEEESKHAVWASFPVQRSKSLLLKQKTKSSEKGKTSLKTKNNNEVKENRAQKKHLKIVEIKEGIIQNEIIKNNNHPNNSVRSKKQKVKKHKLETGESDDIKKSSSVTQVVKTKTKENNANQKKEEKVPISDDSVIQKKKPKKRKLEDADVSKNKKVKKDINQPKKQIKADLTETDLKRIEKKKQKRIKQLLKKKQFKEQKKQQKTDTGSEQQTPNETENTHSDEIVINSAQSKDDTKQNNTLEKRNDSRKPFKKPFTPLKNKKNERIDGEHKRKKPHLPHKLFINGKELEIAYIEGFPVKKEDGDRLKKLRKEMISKGLPRSQIDVALKLERRKAEKALAREKKKVSIKYLYKIIISAILPLLKISINTLVKI